VALLEIVRADLAHEKAKTATVPFGNLFDEFLATKAVRNPKYVKELKLTRERFRRFDKVLAADVQPKALSDVKGNALSCEELTFCEGAPFLC
jgi:hypothetical protein